MNHTVGANQMVKSEPLIIPQLGYVVFYITKFGIHDIQACMKLLTNLLKSNITTNKATNKAIYYYLSISLLSAHLTFSRQP